VGTYPHPDPARGNLVAAPFLGRIDAPTAELIAALAAGFADDLRVTPRRSLAFCGVLWSQLAELERALAGRGLTSDPADPRVRVSACVGSQGCASGRADTAVEAARRAGQLLGESRVHLSACEKGCGAPAGIRHLVADEAGRFTDAGAGS
jgi:precorrin-3B synthase